MYRMVSKECLPTDNNRSGQEDSYDRFGGPYHYYGRRERSRPCWDRPYFEYEADDRSYGGQEPWRWDIPNFDDEADDYYLGRFSRSHRDRNEPTYFYEGDDGWYGAQDRWTWVEPGYGGEDHRASNGKGHSMTPKATMDTTVAVLHGDWRSRINVLMAESEPASWSLLSHGKSRFLPTVTCSIPCFSSRSSLWLYLCYQGKLGCVRTG